VDVEVVRLLVRLAKEKLLFPDVGGELILEAVLSFASFAFEFEFVVLPSPPEATDLAAVVTTPRAEAANPDIVPPMTLLHDPALALPLLREAAAAAGAAGVATGAAEESAVAILSEEDAPPPPPSVGEDVVAGGRETMVGPPPSRLGVVESIIA